MDMGRLVLSRKIEQEIVIGGNVRIKVLGIHGNKVRLGIDAPLTQAIRRAEAPADPERQRQLEQQPRP